MGWAKSATTVTKLVEGPKGATIAGSFCLSGIMVSNEAACKFSVFKEGYQGFRAADISFKIIFLILNKVCREEEQNEVSSVDLATLRVTMMLELVGATCGLGIVGYKVGTTRWHKDDLLAG